MGRLQLSGFRDRLQTILGNRGFTASELEDWIHDGLYELSGAVDFPEDECITTLDTVADREEYTLPSDLRGIMSLRLDGERKLNRISTEEWFLKDWDETGVPELYSRDERSLRLFPVPDAVYTMRLLYRRTPAALSADSDLSPYQAMWDRAILFFAAHHAHMDLGENARAGDFLRRAAIYVRTRIQADEIESAAEAERGLNIALDRSDRQGLEG